jgi:branched-chain amino acid transport system substrate-binding protein
MTTELPRRTAMGLAAGAVLGTATRAQAQAKTAKMALLAPMSGPWARTGSQMLSGAQMAIDDVNAAGGIKALGGMKMELVVIDASDTAEKAKDAAQRMVAQQPDLIGGTGAWLSSFTLAVTEVTERAELPWLTLSYSDAITSRGFRYVFQTTPTADEQSTRALPTILDLAKRATGKDARSVGIVGDNTASVVSFLKPIRATELAKHNLKAVVDEIYTPPLADATSIVQRVRSARPEFLLCITTNVPDTKILLDKFNEFGLGCTKLPKIGSGGQMGAPELADVIGADIMEGMMAIVGNWGGKGQEDLAKRFMARTKEPWLNQDSILTYADVMIFKEAMEKAGSTDRRKVADAIRAFDLRDGPAKYYPGSHLQFDSRGRRVDAGLVIIQWQGGKALAVFPPDVATAEATWPKA